MIKEKKEINGRKVEIERFAAVKAFKVKTKLFKIVAAPLAGLVQTGDMLNTDLNLIKTIETLVFNIGDEEKFFALILELLSQTTIYQYNEQIKQEEPIKIINETGFNTVFAKGLKDLYAILFFVLQVNYSDLFEVVGRNIGDLKDIFQKIPKSEKPVI
jgi:hypothetical protein